jgi:hypothetical protein
LALFFASRHDATTLRVAQEGCYWENRASSHATEAWALGCSRRKRGVPLNNFGSVVFFLFLFFRKQHIKNKYRAKDVASLRRGVSQFTEHKFQRSFCHFSG